MIRTYGPYLEMARIQSEINRLFESLGELRGPGEAEPGFLPTVDVVDQGDRLVVEVELPGLTADEVSLAVNGPDVIIRGEKRRDAAEGASRVASDRSFGGFERIVPLGVPVNTHRAEAVLRQGLLRITFPKVNNKRGEPVSVDIREE